MMYQIKFTYENEEQEGLLFYNSNTIFKSKKKAIEVTDALWEKVRDEGDVLISVSYRGLTPWKSVSD